jgi:hypothetical protein
MVRILVASVALVGLTVVGGMGLAFAHDYVFEVPQPVRAEVVEPVKTEKFQPRQPALVVIEPSTPPQEDVVRIVATAYQAEQPTFSDVVRPKPTTSAPDVLDFEVFAPVASTRPQARQTLSVVERTTRTVEVSGLVLPRQIPRGHRPAPQVLNRHVPVPQAHVPQSTATREVNTRALIGVYR